MDKYPWWPARVVTKWTNGEIYVRFIDVDKQDAEPSGPIDVNMIKPF